MNEVSWWAVATARGYELNYVDFLQKNNIPCFLPVLSHNGKSVPALYNLCFAQATQAQLEQLRASEGSLHSRFFVNSSTQLPVTVSDSDVQQLKTLFLPNLPVTFLDARRTNAKPGPQVLVSSGPFKGLRGEYLRVHGNRCVVVRIPSLAVMATPFIQPDFITPV